jgi:hypothetical protein
MRAWIQHCAAATAALGQPSRTGMKMFENNMLKFEINFGTHDAKLVDTKKSGFDTRFLDKN